MSQEIPGLVLYGKHGRTPHGPFWQGTTGMLTLYSTQYPRGCVILDEKGGVIAMNDDRPGLPHLESDVQRHYAAAMEAITAGDVTEFRPGDDPAKIARARMTEDEAELMDLRVTIYPADDAPEAPAAERRRRSM